MLTALSLQRTIGNAGVVAMLARGGPGLAAVTVQRSPEDVFTLVNTFQGRLARTTGFEAAASKILTEFEDFARQGNDPDTRAELRKRAPMMSESLLSGTVSPATRKRIQDVLGELAKTGGTAAPLTIGPTSKAATVWRALLEGVAPVHGLQAKWYISKDDKKINGYSTAYRLGNNCTWEIHVHRNAKRQALTCSVQQVATLGTRERTQRWLEPAKLQSIGVPALHYPQSREKCWAGM